MDTRLLAIICFGALALFLCFFAGFFTKTEKVKTFIMLKSLASFSYVLLGLIACNLVYNLNANSLFIIIGLVIFLVSTVVRAIPTKTDMFHVFYTLIESLGFASFIVSMFFLIEKPFIGLIAGAGTFVVLMTVYLIVKKAHVKKDKLVNLLLQLASSLFLGISVNLAIILVSIQSFLIAGGALLVFVYTIIQTFSHFTNKKCGAAKNILLGFGLICLALAIYFI